VAGATLSPIDDRSRGVTWPVVELPSFDPIGCSFAKIWPYRTERTSDTVGLACHKQAQQPSLGWKFVVIDKSNVVALSVLDGHVSRKWNALLNLHTISDGDT